MISTEAEPKDAEEAYRNGANLYLVKPAAAELLLRSAALLTGHRTPQPGGDS
jgi:two-component system chemotaxis response regulator CheY